MAIEIKAPAFPESVADGEVAAWHKGEGDSVQRDELLVEIETDKVVMGSGRTGVGHAEQNHVRRGRHDRERSSPCSSRARRGCSSLPPPRNAPEAAAASGTDAGAEPAFGPAVRQLLDEHKLDPSAIKGTGKDGRLV